MITFLLAVLLAVGAVAFVLHPVVFGVEAPLKRTDEDPTEAHVRKNTALRALRDVEYDFHTGKLNEQDYRRLRNDVAREAAAAIRAADEDRPGSTADRDEAREAIEAEIQRYRERLREGLQCPECGRANGPGSRFCGQCGTRLPLPEPGSESSEVEV